MNSDGTNLRGGWYSGYVLIDNHHLSGYGVFKNDTGDWCIMMPNRHSRASIPGWDEETAKAKAMELAAEKD